MKTMACQVHPRNDKPYHCTGCSEALRAFRSAMQEWRLSQGKEMRARVLQSRRTPKPLTPEQRMDQTTWEQWSKRKYQRNRDEEIRRVYRSEIYPRGFRNAVPAWAQTVDQINGPRAFYSIFALERKLGRSID